jgi:hypothetical protein
VLEAHDAVFWLGDLNYRINGNSKAVRYLMRSMLHEVLHANDQLRLQQRQGLAFQVTVTACAAGHATRVREGPARWRLAAPLAVCWPGALRVPDTVAHVHGCCWWRQGFAEGAIRFPPTFKFHPGSSVYSEQRVPSWTDRVLWRVRSTPQPSEQQPSAPGTPNGSSTFLASDLPPPEVAQLYYTSVPQVVSSDHKPVIAGFVLAVPGADEAVGDGLSCSDGGGHEAPLSLPCCCMM